jgi:hypothetical protein
LFVIACINVDQLLLSHVLEMEAQSTIAPAVQQPQWSLPQPPLAFSATMSAVVSLESIAALLFNPLTIAAIQKSRLSKKSATSLFISSMSIADFLTGVGILCYQILRWIVQVRGVNPYLVAASWITSSVAAVATPLSLYSSISIGVDRVIATSYPMRHKTMMSIKNAKIILVFEYLWVVLVVLAPVIFKYSTISAEERTQNFIANPPDVYPKVYFSYFSTPSLYGLLTATTILYIKVFLAYKKAASKVRGKNDQTVGTKSRKLTKMAIMVNALLIVCWAPLALVAGLPPPNPVERPNHFVAYLMFYEIVFIFVLLPSFCNNIIYGFQHQDYKMAYMKILGWKNAPEGSVASSSTQKFAQNSQGTQVTQLTQHQ